MTVSDPRDMELSFAVADGGAADGWVDIQYRHIVGFELDANDWPDDTQFYVIESTSTTDTERNADGGLLCDTLGDPIYFSNGTDDFTWGTLHIMIDPVSYVGLRYITIVAKDSGGSDAAPTSDTTIKPIVREYR